MSNLLKELLALDDDALLKHEAVVEFYATIGTIYCGPCRLNKRPAEECGDCMGNTISDPIEKVAFDMRNACIEKHGPLKWMLNAKDVVFASGKSQYWDVFCTQTHWIVAATLIWKESQQQQELQKDSGQINESNVK